MIILKEILIVGVFVALIYLALWQLIKRAKETGPTFNAPSNEPFSPLDS